jgi:hypothetical protein
MDEHCSCSFSNCSDVSFRYAVLVVGIYTAEIDVLVLGSTAVFE